MQVKEKERTERSPINREIANPKHAKPVFFFYGNKGRVFLPGLALVPLENVSGVFRQYLILWMTMKRERERKKSAAEGEKEEGKKNVGWIESRLLLMLLQPADFGTIDSPDSYACGSTHSRNTSAGNLFFLLWIIGYFKAHFYLSFLVLCEGPHKSAPFRDTL